MLYVWPRTATARDSTPLMRARFFAKDIFPSWVSSLVVCAEIGAWKCRDIQKGRQGSQEKYPGACLSRAVSEWNNNRGLAPGKEKVL